ncbi:MAG: autotransporter assembly complex family protein [Rhodanobacteraceae bacterium]
MRALLLMLLLPVTANAAVKLKVQGVEDPLRHAVVEGVQLSQYGNRNVTEAQVHRLYAQAEEQARKALRPYGYFDAEVSGSITPQGKDWQVDLSVTPGEPVKVDRVDIKLGDAAEKLPDVRAAVRGFRPRKGDILDQGQYTESRDAISAALTAVGFLDARLTTHRVEVYRADHRAEVRLEWDVGRRYRFGQIRFEGSQFKPGFLERYVPFQSGDWFSQDQLLALQQALAGADYFAIVNVLPQVDDARDGKVDVKVKLVPAKRSIYSGGPFVGTDVGLGFRLGVERRWMNRSGHKWNNELIVAQRLKSLSSQYTIPMPGPHQRSFNLGGNYRDADTRSSHSRTLDLVGNETRQWKGWTRTLGVHVLAGTFTVGQRGNEPRDTPGVQHGRSTEVFGEASLLKKQADNPSFVRQGWSLTLSARSTAAGLLSDTRYTQVMADGKWIHALSSRNRLILRGTAGMSSVGDFSRLPPELRFFAGGARSVRGYGFESIGPRNSYDRVVGGHNLLVGSSEVEHYFSRNWGVAAFVDAGNAFDGSDYRPRVGAGLGMRWRSPVGMIRVDLAVPVNDSHSRGVHLHLVIGPDL